jgi:4'-phosphopantetheinyl transferase
MQSEPPPDGDEWLSAAEAARLATLRVAKRRQEWRLGRWTAKQLVRGVMAERGVWLESADIPIATLPSGAPTIDRPDLPFELSISHRRGRALCAIAPREGGPIGADIEQVAPRLPGFAAEYFTEEEQAQVAAVSADADQRDLLITALWSAKEAALKALQVGLTVSTRTVSCLAHGVPSAEWAPLRISVNPALWPRDSEPPPALLRGWWRSDPPFVLTLAVHDG